MFAARYWVYSVVSWIELVLLVVTLAVAIGAFIHCLTQRADAFGAIGTLSKAAWLGLIGVTLLLALLLGTNGVGLFSLVAVGVALVYLLDVRPALRDIAGGRGPW